MSFTRVILNDTFKLIQLFVFRAAGVFEPMERTGQLATTSYTSFFGSLELQVLGSIEYCVEPRNG